MALSIQALYAEYKESHLDRGVTQNAWGDHRSVFPLNVLEHLQDKGAALSYMQNEGATFFKNWSREERQSLLNNIAPMLDYARQTGATELEFFDRQWQIPGRIQDAGLVQGYQQYLEETNGRSTDRMVFFIGQNHPKEGREVGDVHAYGAIVDAQGNVKGILQPTDLEWSLGDHLRPAIAGVYHFDTTTGAYRDIQSAAELEAFLAKPMDDMGMRHGGKYQGEATDKGAQAHNWDGYHPLHEGDPLTPENKGLIFNYVGQLGMELPSSPRTEAMMLLTYEESKLQLDQATNLPVTIPSYEPMFVDGKLIIDSEQLAKINGAVRRTFTQEGFTGNEVQNYEGEVTITRGSGETSTYTVKDGVIQDYKVPLDEEVTMTVLASEWRQVVASDRTQGSRPYSHDGQHGKNAIPGSDNCLTFFTTMLERGGIPDVLQTLLNAANVESAKFRPANLEVITHGISGHAGDEDYPAAVAARATDKSVKFGEHTVPAHALKTANGVPINVFDLKSIFEERTAAIENAKTPEAQAKGTEVPYFDDWKSVGEVVTMARGLREQERQSGVTVAKRAVGSNTVG